MERAEKILGLNRWPNPSKHHSRIRIKIAAPDTNPAPAPVSDRVDTGTPSKKASPRNIDLHPLLSLIAFPILEYVYLSYFYTIFL